MSNMVMTAESFGLESSFQNTKRRGRPPAEKSNDTIVNVRLYDSRNLNATHR